MSDQLPRPIPYAEALRLIEANVAPLGIETVSLQKSLGRLLAQALVAPFDVPHFDNSQVDGYAISAKSVGERQVIGESAAGTVSPTAIDQSEALRIFTGAPMPKGADAVVMQEDATVTEGRLSFDLSVTSGDNVRFRAEEITAGTTYNEFNGLPMTPPIIGLAASFGLTQIAVSKAPSVTVIATGNELVLPGRPLTPGSVYASNPEAIAAALRPFGIEARIEIVSDDPTATRSVLGTALEESNVVITVGGVSVGEHDLVRPTFLALGVDQIFWRVAIKPGKPIFFGRKGQKYVFGLPGNPVSALVTFSALVRPALLQILGDRRKELTTMVELGETIERNDLRYEFLRVELRNGKAYPLKGQGSHMQTGLALADALLHIPEGVARIEAGHRVDITPLRWNL